MREKLVITIDGPAGAGKSTVSKVLAERMSYIYLDTGALYRAVAYTVAKEGISPDNENCLSNLLGRTKIFLRNMDGRTIKVFVNDEDVTEKIKTEKTGLLASKVSAIPLVRNALLSIQREMGKEGGIVAEGRDMGTVVFPDADCKFFLDASVEERVKRRYNELVMRGVHRDYRDVERDLLIRDRQDRERKTAPLQVSRDAIIIDSTNMTVSEIVEKMVTIVRRTS
ncbi:MAG: (d)CMP kinase [Syntrophales bacterium]|nr:(d)CMP kinase [Syntrophales bacterium]